MFKKMEKPKSCGSKNIDEIIKEIESSLNSNSHSSSKSDMNLHFSESLIQTPVHNSTFVFLS